MTIRTLAQSLHAQSLNLFPMVLKPKLFYSFHQIRFIDTNARVLTCFCTRLMTSVLSFEQIFLWLDVQLDDQLPSPNCITDQATWKEIIVLWIAPSQN